MALTLLRVHPALVGPVRWTSEAFASVVHAVAPDHVAFRAAWIPSEFDPWFCEWVAHEPRTRARLVVRYLEQAFPDDARLVIGWSLDAKAEATRELDDALAGRFDHQWQRLSLGSHADSFLRVPGSDSEPRLTCPDWAAPDELLANFTHAVLGETERRVQASTVFGFRGRAAHLASRLAQTGTFVRPGSTMDELGKAMAPGGHLFELFVSSAGE